MAGGFRGTGNAVRKLSFLRVGSVLRTRNPYFFTSKQNCMRNTETKTKPVAATGKLTKEQAQILFTVEKNKYTAEELENLFMYLNKLNLADFSYSLDELIGDYLSSAEAISGMELTGLCNLFKFNRVLSDMAFIK